MKKLSLLAAFVAGLVITGCSHEEPEVTNINPEAETPDWDKDTITISFTRAMETHIEPFDDSANARTRGDISSSANRLDVWLIQGTDTSVVHQQSSDADFGTVSLSVNKTKEYTMKAVAHKCRGEAQMKAGVVSFPEGEIKHTLYAMHKFKPDTISGQLAVDMNRIVGMFKFATTDAIPESVYTMRFCIKNSPQQFNTATLTGTAAADRTVDFSGFSRKNDGTAAFTLYVLPDDLTAQHAYDVEVTALDDKGATIESCTFSDVPIRANYRTQYTGQFFVSRTASFTFTIGDWNDFDPVNF